MNETFFKTNYDDYILLEKVEYKNNQSQYKMRCKICGHEKICGMSNIKRQDNHHSKLNCKNDYYKDFIGKTINDYQCIGIKKDIQDGYLLKFKCSKCGNLHNSRYNDMLKLEHSYRNCGNKYYKSFIGKVYGDFTIIKFLRRQNSTGVFKLKCNKCGEEITKTLFALENKKFIHGVECWKALKNTKYKKAFAGRFNNMKQRCENPLNANYNYYGARGIKVKYEYPIDLYHDFIDEFIEHSKIHGITQSTFDRIDVNGNYEKNNLRITTLEIQNINCTDRRFFIIEKDGNRIIGDSAIHVGKILKINGRSLGNVIRQTNKSCYGWKLIKILKNVTKENINDIIEQEGVTTNLIISL